MTSQLFYVSTYIALGQTLHDADVAAAAALGTLVLDATVTQSSSLTLAAPRVQGGGGIVTLSGGTTVLTINGVLAGEGQMFATSGSGGIALVAGSSLDVKWFGAKGDGSTPDTVAFNAALASAASLSEGGEIYVPPGVYNITGNGISIWPTGLTGLTIRGAGRRSSVLLSSVTSGPMLFIGDPAATFATDGVLLEDLGFQTNAGAAATTGETELCHLNFCRDARVTRCGFQGGFATQLLISHPQGFTVRDSDFHGTKQGAPAVAAASSGIVLAPGNSTVVNPQNSGQAGRITNCTIRDFHTPDCTAIAVNMLAASGSEFAVVDCDIENNDCSVNCDVGRTQVVRNSFESGNVRTAAGIAGANSSGAFTGKGAFTPDATTPLVSGAQAGAYRIKCTATAPNSGTFTVFDPSGSNLGTVVVGSTWNNQIKFVITDGNPDFALNDTFTFNVVSVPAATAAASGSNTGNGTIAMTAATPVIGGGQIGTYRATCTTAAIGGGTFTVLDPYNITVGTVAAGSAFATQVGFTITAGVTDFAVGDTFEIDATSTPLVSNVALSPSNVLERGVNTGNGTIAMDATTPTLTNIQHGTYKAACTTTAIGGGTFTITDPQGTTLGTVAVGSTFATQVKFVISAGSTDFALGDTFLVNAIGDVMVKIGRGATVTANYFLHNTMSADAVAGIRFFDLYSYRDMFIDYNLFITAVGYTCYFSADHGNKTSSFRFNGGMDPRTQILFNSQAGVPGQPNLVDGKWWISDCDEGSATNGRDVMVANATTPSVANLEEIVTNNGTTATTITNFINGHIGQSLLVSFADAVTTVQNGGSIFLIGGTNVTYANGALSLFHASLGGTGSSQPVWREVARLPA